MTSSDVSAAASAASERLGAALGRLEQREGGDPVLEDARDTVRAVLSLHAAALGRLLEIAAAQGEAGRALASALAEDELVGSILALHGLHPIPLDRRVREALERIAPRLTGEGASIALVELRPDALRLRLDGAPGGSGAGLARLVESALCGSAPDAPPLEIDFTPRADEALVPVERLLDRRRAAQPAAVESPSSGGDRCELCGAAVGAEHGHLVDPAARQLVCSCPACVRKLGGGEGRWRRVARRARALQDFRLDDARWADLGIPVDVAFFMCSSAAGRVIALYPGPAGATESLLSLDAWQAIVDDNPGFAALEPDVEALLVSRALGVQYRVSIDVAYELVGVLRRSWRGLSGGGDARRAIADFFARLASPLGGPACSV